MLQRNLATPRAASAAASAQTRANPDSCTYTNGATDVKLEIQNVTKSFRMTGGDAFKVLDDVSLQVRDLEFLVLLGPSGCGKSTLLRIVDGLMPCDSGKVLMHGDDITNTTGNGRGMVFQSFDLFPWRTVRKNIEFGLEVLGVDARERRESSAHYIDLMGLTGFEEAFPHQLSGGMQQRVGIARALAIKPELLLMDEPYGALDVQTRDLLQDELLKLWDREKKTVIFVTHSIEEALYLADRIVVFTPRPGRIERIIDVPFDRPRDESIKILPEFLQLRQEIWQLLKAGARV